MPDDKKPNEGHSGGENPFGGGDKKPDDGKGNNTNPFGGGGTTKPDDGNKKPDSGNPFDTGGGKKPDTGNPFDTGGDKKPDQGNTPTTPIKPQDPLSTATQNAVNGVGSLTSVVPGVANQLANQMMPLPQVSLQIKAIDQKELREFNAEYNSRKATQRVYRPQGFFGLSQAVLDKLPPGAFLEIDTNDEFWRSFEVGVHGPASEDFSQLGLRSAVVQIDYGDPKGGTNKVSKSFRFNSASDADTVQKFSNPMITGHYDYRYRITYAFDGSWTGDAAQRDIDPVETLVRDVFVLPQRDFKFVTVNASFTNPPDWSLLSQIHLSITCSSGSKDLPESFDKKVVIYEGWVPALGPVDATQPAPPLPWRIRFKDPSKEARVLIRYEATYVMRDGSKQTVSEETNDPNLILLPLPPPKS